MKSSVYKGLLMLVWACGAHLVLSQSTTQATTPLGAAGPQEEIEWTWEVRPAHADPQLPNVLLVGDSITRNYFPEVQKQLAGVANVYLFATSACAGDPRLPRQLKEFKTMERVRFQALHFNNGMHGWTYTEADYATGLKDMLRAVQKIAPKVALVWADTTPVRAETEPGPTNARIDARNAAALAIIHKAGLILDDQHELMKKHADLYEDNVHFNSVGAAVQGDQAAALIRGLLRKGNAYRGSKY